MSGISKMYHTNSFCYRRWRKLNILPSCWVERLAFQQNSCSYFSQLAAVVCTHNRPFWLFEAYIRIHAFGARMMFALGTNSEFPKCALLPPVENRVLMQYWWSAPWNQKLCLINFYGNNLTSLEPKHFCWTVSVILYWTETEWQLKCLPFAVGSLGVPGTGTCKNMEQIY